MVAAGVSNGRYYLARRVRDRQHILTHVVVSLSIALVNFVDNSHDHTGASGRQNSGCAFLVLGDVADHTTTQDFKGQKTADDIVRVVLIASTVRALRRLCI